jgi:PAS domain S-box-containing protein
MTETVASTFVIDELLIEIDAVALLVKHHGFEAVTMSRESLMVCLMDGFLPDGVLLEADSQGQLAMEICALLSQHELTSHIPVLLVATDPSSEMERLAFEAGAADFMTRPISPASLLIRLEHRLRAWRERHTAALPDSVKRAAETLAIKAQDLGLTLMNALPDICFVKDTVGRFVYCNPAFERLYGLRESLVLGKTDYEFVPKSQARHFEWEDQKVLASGQPVSSIAWQTLGTGKKVLYETLKTPVYNAQEEVVGLMGVGRDITRWKQGEDALNREHSEIGSLSVQTTPQSNLLLLAGVNGLNVRMEPLVASGIMVTSTLAQGLEKLADQFSGGKVTKTAFNEYLYKTRQGFELLEAELQRCNRLVETMSRLAWASQAEGDADLNLSQLIGRTVERNQFKATAQGIELVVQAVADVRVKGTVEGWQYVVQQLLDNAIAHAFTGERKGIVRLTLVESREWAELTVADNGVGLAVTDANDIFAPYHTTGDATLHAGMGLTLIRHIVANHWKGQTDAQHTAGGGLTISIQVPLCSTMAAFRP